MRNEKGQKSNLICELASQTYDAERAARVARGCREEQDDAIDDPGDVDEEDRRHNWEEKSKSQDHVLVSLIGQGASPCLHIPDKEEDQERKKAVNEQPD